MLLKTLHIHLYHEKNHWLIIQRKLFKKKDLKHLRKKFLNLKLSEKSLKEKFLDK